MPVLEGGCLCGSLRYDVEAPFAAVILCHCRSCQRQSGAAFSVNAIANDAAFRLTGVPAVFRDQGESGGAVDRLFCPRCGSPIATVADAAPGMVAIKAGTLDDPVAATPDGEIYARSACPWMPPLGSAWREQGPPPR